MPANITPINHPIEQQRRRLNAQNLTSTFALLGLDDRDVRDMRWAYADGMKVRMVRILRDADMRDHGRVDPLRAYVMIADTLLAL